MWLAYACVLYLFINTLGKLVDMKKHEFRRVANPYVPQFPWKKRDVPKIVQYATLPPITRNNTYEIVAKFLHEMESENSTPTPVNLKNVFNKWSRDRVKEVIVNSLVKISKKEEIKPIERNKILNKNVLSENKLRDLRTYQPFENDKKLKHRTITIKKEGMILPMFKSTKHRELFDKLDNSVSATDSLTDEKKKDPYDNIIDFVFLYPGATKKPKLRAIQPENYINESNEKNDTQPVKDKLFLPRALLKAMFPKVRIVLRDETDNYQKNMSLYETNQTTIKMNSREWIKNKLANLRHHYNNSIAKWRNSDRVLEYTLPNKRNKVEIKPITITKLRKRRQVIQNVSDVAGIEDNTTFLDRNEVRSVSIHIPINNERKIQNLSLTEPKMHLKLTLNEGRHEKSVTNKNVTLENLFQLMRKHETTLTEILEMLKRLARDKNDIDRPKDTNRRFAELKAILDSNSDVLNKPNETEELNEVIESQTFPTHDLSQFSEPSIRQAHFDKKLVKIANRIIHVDNSPKEKRPFCALNAYRPKEKHKVLKRDLESDEDKFTEYDSFNENADEELYKPSDDLMVTNADLPSSPADEEFNVKRYYKQAPTTTPTTTQKTRHKNEMISPIPEEFLWTTVITDPRPKFHKKKSRYYWEQINGINEASRKIETGDDSQNLTDYSKKIRTMLGKTFTIRRKMHHIDKKYKTSQQKMDSDNVHRVEVIVYGKLPGSDQNEVKPMQKFTVFNNKNNKHFKSNEKFSKESLLSHPQIRQFLPFDPKNFLTGVSEGSTMSTINNEIEEDTIPVTNTNKIVTTTVTPSENKTTVTVETPRTASSPRTTVTRTPVPQPKPTATKPKPTITTYKPPTTTGLLTHTQSLKTTDTSTVALNTTADLSTVELNITRASPTSSTLSTILSSITTMKQEQIPEIHIEIEKEPKDKYDRTEKAYMHSVKVITDIVDNSLNDDFVPADHTEVHPKILPTGANNLDLPSYKTNNNLTSTIPSQDRKNSTFLHLQHYPYIVEKLGKGDIHDMDRIRNELLTTNQLIDLWVHHKNSRRNSVIGGVWPLELWKTIHLKSKRTTTTPFPRIKSKLKLENEEFYEYFDDEYAVRRKRGANARVLCTIIRKTSEEHMVHHIKNTWGKRCDILLFISSKKAEARTQWEFVLAGLRFVYNGYHDVEWIVKADVSTYIVVENLLIMLKGRDPNKPLYFGRPSYMDYHSFVLSKAGLNKLATRAPETIECQYVQEVGIRPCLDNVGVKEINPVDQYKRALFYPFGPFSWKPDDNHMPEEALQTWSDYAVSFNNLSYRDLYTMEYFIYHMNPLQIPQEYMDRVRNLNLGTDDKKQRHNRKS